MNTSVAATSWTTLFISVAPVMLAAIAPCVYCSYSAYSKTTTTLDNTKDEPYGSWESPITSKAITAGSVKISSLHIDPSNNETLLWLEGRPEEGGRYVLCQYAPNDSQKNERDAVDITPLESNVRTRVHEYGGGSFTLGGNDGDGIFYSEFTTQRLMKLSRGKEGGESKKTMAPIPVTPGGNQYRFADGDIVHDKFVLVRECHKNGAETASTDVVNELVQLTKKTHDTNTDDIMDIKVFAKGNDFYAHPRISPNGKYVAYITWNHPNMPWDSTELRVLSFVEDDNRTPSASSNDHQLVSGSIDGNVSVMQPKWHPITNDLYYISDVTGYYNIYRVSFDDDNETTREAISILPMDSDFGGSTPGWYLGQQGYSFLPDGRLVATYSKKGKTRLVVVDVISCTSNSQLPEWKEYSSDDFGLPMQFGDVTPSASEDTNGLLYFVGGSPSTPASVYKWSLNTPDTPAELLARSSSLSFPDDVISIPEKIEFPTVLGKAYGYYYPPKNDAYKCTTDKAGPPLLVKAHGGPTASTSTLFDPKIQYWTSRGFAIIDVDYGGSSGYGRSYRERLVKSWGIVDVDDVCHGAQYLASKGLADPDRLCIDGGSAGGYTTLSALTFRDVFKAGCSLFGVGDLGALVRATHKFESRYLDNLIGKYPEEEHIYKERSPIENVDKLNSPILLLQGVEDQIVPKNQAEKMYEALKKKKIPTLLKIYEGEQHGFRKAENIEDAMDMELAFFGQIFGITIPNALDIEIENIVRVKRDENTTPY